MRKETKEYTTLYADEGKVIVDVENLIYFGEKVSFGDNISEDRFSEMTMEEWIALLPEEIEEEDIEDIE